MLITFDTISSGSYRVITDLGPSAQMHRKLTLDVGDSAILKGLAILAIAFHNYFHLLSPAKENEFDFDPARVFLFLNAVRDPRDSVQALFSFFGHYGVQVFVFLSAYGLAIKYWESEPEWAPFVWGRVQKIYSTFLIVIGLWALIVGFPAGFKGPLEVIRTDCTSLILMLLGISNLVPGYGLPPVGPWWFVPFIIQFYCVWPLLRHVVKRFGPRALIAMAAASLLLVGAANNLLIARCQIDLMMSPLGRLPEICLGIAVARYGFFPGRTGIVSSGALFLLSLFFGWLWPLGFPCATILMLSAYRCVRARLHEIAVFSRVGACSLALFLVNGFTRLPFFLVASREKDWRLEILLGFASVGCAWIFAELLTRRIGGSRNGAAKVLGAGLVARA